MGNCPVVPIFKKGSQKNSSNYRSISLTSCVCKFKESWLKKVIRENRTLIRPTQFEFVPKLSCENQLLEYLEDITPTLDESKCIDVAYLDFSKAFATTLM